jgi:hypothetical protein
MKPQLVFYLLGNIRPNQVMVALRDLVKTPLYINAKISVKPLWENMFNIAKTQQSNFQHIARNGIRHGTKLKKQLKSLPQYFGSKFIIVRSNYEQ